MREKGGGSVVAVPTGTVKSTATDNPPVLTPAARRALTEALERRSEACATEEPKPPERGGREGPEPVRYGDWENKGLASDF